MRWKRYIALFSCCVTRAIHLDLTTDLSATTFIRLRKFAVRRGTPALIIADNAKTFKATSKATQLTRLGEDSEVVAHLTKNRIEWRFNLERAPWWGGFYEWMVGSVKRKVKSEDNIKRNCWKLGKVEELVVGKDQVIRGAKLKVLTKGKPVYLSRPIQKLYPLEVSHGCKVLPLRLIRAGKLELCLTLKP